MYFVAVVGSISPSYRLMYGVVFAPDNFRKPITGGYTVWFLGLDCFLPEDNQPIELLCCRMLS